MPTDFQYALFAGAAYISNRSDQNKFPVPAGWTSMRHETQPSGFEATAFGNATSIDASSEIVISFAGTELWSAGDWSANANLANGEMSAQLLQAVDYYLKIKADNPNATITFTGHSLGGGLAALMGVFFDKTAVTFDQAPFGGSALLSSDVATQLRDSLVARTGLTGNAAAARDNLIADLTGFLSMRETHRGIPRVDRISNYVMDGEFLEGVSAAFPSGRIGKVIELTHGDYYKPFSLHSQALLTAFMLNDGFRQATETLSPLLAMIFDGNLFKQDTSPGSDKTNLLEHLIRHQIGIRDSTGAVTLPADGALDRFVSDLQKITSTPGLATAANLTQALIAFAMQAYYEGGSIANQAGKQLFEQTGGGLHFDRYDIVGGLSDIKGYTLYFKDWLNTLPDDAKREINAKLDSLFDWYLAGTSMNAQAGSEAAFMLGAANLDSLTGSSQDDLLVGLGGNDYLDGRSGDDTLVGGDGYDTYVYRIGDGDDTIIDSDKKGRIFIISADGKTTYAASIFTKDKNNPDNYQSADGQVRLVNGGGGWQLEIGGGTVTLEGVTEEELAGFGIHLRDAAEEMGEVRPTNAIVGDQKDNKNDVLSGTGDAETIEGLTADDHLYGAGGNDKLLGGDGNDTLEGGEGDDLIEGNDGDDLARGGAGRDRLLGGKGDDLLNGGWQDGELEFGDDVLIGGEGHDTLMGQDGNDSLYAEEETTVTDALAVQDDGATGERGDRLLGSWDDDILIGGKGNDTLLGGIDNDIIVGGAGDDNVYGDLEIEWIYQDWNMTRSVEQKGDLTEYKLTFNGIDGAMDDSGSGHDVIYGGGGEDWVMAGKGDDWVDGGIGNDVIWGNDGSDVLFGGEGDDTVDGDMSADNDGTGHGNDSLDGGLGSDTLRGCGGDDTLNGGEGNDKLAGDAIKLDDGSGLPGNFHGKDFLNGGAGDDNLWGNGNDDVLLGGDGNDVLDGDYFDSSRLEGEFHGNDTLSGGAGNDVLVGGGGADVLLGGDGDDGLAGDVADNGNLDPVFQGDDILDGGSGHDSLDGQGGNDTLVGGTGADLLEGGDGNDLYIFSTGDGQLADDGTSDWIIDTGGVDTVSIGGGIQGVYQGAGTSSLGIYYGDNDRVWIEDGANGSIENFGIGDGAMSLAELVGRYATSAVIGNGWAMGGKANDTISVGKGDLQITGGAGNDAITMYGNNNVVRFNRGDGLDTIRATAHTGGQTAPNTLSFGSGIGPEELFLKRDGNDLLIRLPASGDEVRVVEYFINTSKIEYIQFFDGTKWDSATVDAHLDQTLTEGADNYTATNSNDTIDALGGDDTIRGAGGDDLILGGLGADKLYGEDGADELRGGEGNDVLVGDESWPVGGDDLLYGEAGNDKLSGGSGNDLLDGGSGDDWLSGEDGDDTLDGGLGVDTLNGGNGNDTLRGGTLGDTLNGGAGNDVLQGGAGADVIYGGSGSDTVLFSRGDGDDSVYCDDSSADAVDALVFGDGILPSDIGVTQYYNTVTLQIGTSSDYVNLIDYMKFGNEAARLDEIRFQDGTVWRQADVQARLPRPTENGEQLYGTGGDVTIDALGGNDTLLGTAGNETFIGGGGNDLLKGAAGNDVLQGGIGDDKVEGGTGNDTLSGGAGVDILTGQQGDDIYFFARGDGQDTANEYLSGGVAGGFDTIKLGDGVAPSAVTLYRNGSDLILVLDGGSDQLTVSRHFDHVNAQVDRIQFEDGTIWDAAQIVAHTVAGTANAMTGTAGNDTFVVDNAGDSIVEGVNQGIDTVQSGVTWKLGSNLENLTLTGVLNTNATGNELDNAIVGNDGNNVLYDGGAGEFSYYYDTQGTDTLRGGKGDDTYYVSYADSVVEQANEGFDTVYSRDSYTMPENVERLLIDSNDPYKATATGNANDNLIEIRPGDDADGKGGADTVVIRRDLGQASTYYPSWQIPGSTVYIDNAGDIVTGQLDGVRVISSIDYRLGAGMWRLELAGNSSASTGSGNSGDNMLLGNERDNVLNGEGGNDTLWGGGGVNQLVGGTGNDTYYLIGPAFDSYNLNNRLSIYGAPPALQDTVVESEGQGYDMVVSIYDYTLTDNVEKLVLDSYSGEWGNQHYAIAGYGNALNNALIGNGGNNILDGRAGADTMDGLTGDDTYYVDNESDVVNEYANSGNDTVCSSIAYTLTADVENLVLTGTGNDTGTGNAVNNRLDGSQSAGANQLIGGLGDDTYVLGVGDSVVELAGEGNDAVLTGSTYSLAGTAIENITLLGSAAIDASGNELDNRLEGNSGNNRLVGGAGNDTYRFGRSGGQDAVVDTDTTSGNYDRLQFNSGVLATDIRLSRQGDNLVVAIAGTSDQITMEGQFGAAGTGIEEISFDDTSTVLSAADILRMVNNQAPVLVTPLADQSAGESSAFNFTLPANAFSDPDVGDTLELSATLSDGSPLPGWLAFDPYTQSFSGTPPLGSVGVTSIKITATDSGGLFVSDVFNFTVLVQDLTLNGTSAVDTLTGGGGNDTLNGLGGNDNLYGNAGNDTLNGGSGSDKMYGGAGNDTYVVDATGDVVTENANEGTEHVQSSVTFTLGSNVENLTLTGTSAINGTGNTLDNVLTGNSAVNTLTGGVGNDTLNGGTGADKLIGGAGNDTYIVDNTGDTITENASEGTDSVQSSVTFTLATNVENLTLTGTSAINGTGNTLNNVLTGNSANNTLSGGTGADTLIGGAGNDTYLIDNTGDVVTENANEGTDLIQSSVTCSLSANVENLTLTGTTAINGTGNALDNVLTGNSANNTLNGGVGNDTIDGGTGNDTMIGGLGNDTYVVNVATDIVTENANEGIDTVKSAVTLTLGNSIENLTLTGTSAINGTGNTLDNVLIGNSAANTLTGGAGNDTIDGGSGSDTMVGGTGNDTYFVNVSTDKITENANEGTDTVNSSVTLTMGNNVENLTLTGTSAINGTGNTLNNILVGNTANNILTANAGNDTLDGGAGTDSLVGGTGNDTYVLGRGYGADTVTENDSTAGNTDIASFLSGIGTDQIWFRHVGTALEVSVIGTSDKLTISNWYSGSQYHVEQFKTADGKSLVDSKVESLVQAMAAFSPPAAGQTTLPSNYQTALQPVLAANWQ